MEIWEATQNWLIFGAIAGGLAWYYYPTASNAVNVRSREQAEPIPAAPKRRNETKSKPAKKPEPASKPEKATESSQRSGKETGKQNKAKKAPHVTQTTPVVVEKDDASDEIDMSTRQFAEQMTQARQGHNLSAPKGKENRVRTVKQGAARVEQPISSTSSHNGADGDDDLSPVPTPAVTAGDVSDMLEPAAAAPTTLRLTSTDTGRKPNASKKAPEAAETKKQRQNRQKAEERKAQREQEEKERKALEEKQRRQAREARGEPAKNGIAVSKPPANNHWTSSGQSAPSTTANSGHLLDTFEVESTGSSNGAHAISTAATSITDINNTQWEQDVSEEEQMAMAMKQSEDESGWTTVSLPKKQKKKTETAGDSTPIAETPSTFKPKAPVAHISTDVKPKGFQALNDHYEQRTDLDPNDADNWDA